MVDLTHARRIFTLTASVDDAQIAGEREGRYPGHAGQGDPDKGPRVEHSRTRTCRFSSRPKRQQRGRTFNRVLYVASTTLSTANVDAIEKLFLDPDMNETLLSLASQFLRCEDYPQGELLVPQQLALTMDGKREDWAAYQPVLSDKGEDLAAGETLDLRALCRRG